MKPVVAALMAALAVLPVTPLPLGAQQAEKLSVEEFIRSAMQDNIADVEVGRMVRSDPAAPQGVQEVGQTISQSSTRINSTLSRLARQHDVAVGNQLEPQDRTAIQQMSKIQGPEFTRQYLQYVIGDLEGNIRMYREATRSDSPDIRQFAEDTLPVLESDLAMARQVWEQQVAEEPAVR